ncbi:MAG: ribosome biogenesis GTPase Der [Candidatus Komeilibacteria bacterium]|nr:ribosome biogenesis GTPase Der [Candidatus Komeilibacteria bacterium]
MAQQARVAIVGRANVGKSTLFNRLTSGPRALVAPEAGTTRDRQERDCTWRGKTFTLIDTGGLDIDTHDPIEREVAKQALKAVSDSALVLFVVDAKVGITPTDREVAKTLRAAGAAVILVANKVDAVRDVASTAELYQLACGDPLAVSAATGAGTGDLLDLVITRIKTRAIQETHPIRIVILGKPNVGKSSLANALVGEERAIVYDEPYTTRDATMIPFIFEGQDMLLVDTAGIRRKSKIDRRTIEQQSVAQSLASIKDADVVLLVTEVHKPVTAQDRQLAELIDHSQASAIIIGNKWDLVGDKDPKKADEFVTYYHAHINFLKWAPVLLLSAKDRTKLTRLKNAIVAAYKERFRKIDENALNKFLKAVISRQTPTLGKGSIRPYIYRLKQAGVNPPQFVVQIKEGANLKYAYLNTIEKMLREKFGFEGSPIKIWIEKIKKKE